jgi:hypothetical protein
MARERAAPDRAAGFLRLKRIATLVELAVHLQCSARTAQRRLTQCRAIHSYNHNARYYTLPQIPQFDAHGLWRYRGVFFSRYGNLPQTFAQLVHQAPAGLTAAEAGERLGLKPSSFLWSLREHPAVKREKHQGLYVYWAGDADRRAAQQQQRAQARPTWRGLTEAEAIAILVEKIKHPAASVAALSRRLDGQNLRVDPAHIGEFLAQHGVGVKKTPHSV